MGRRKHNEDYIRWFLDVSYPNSAPGSPPREQNYDANKPGSRVILRSPAYERLLDEEASRSYYLILSLIDEAAARSWAHRLVSRYVLLNVNSAGGYKDLERIGEVDDEAAQVVAKLCREVISFVLDRLDEYGYWLGWGFQADVQAKRDAAKDRRQKGILATEEDALQAICAYYQLMLDTDRTAAAAEVATSEHMDCSIAKVRKATRMLREEAC